MPPWPRGGRAAVSLLEGIFCTELLCLLSAWILWIAGRMVAKNSPSDTLLRFAQVFWRTFAQRPAPLREVVPDADAAELFQPGGDAALLGDLADTTTPDDDAPPRQAAQGTAVRMATLNIKVIP